MKKKIIYSSALAALLSASSIALAGGPEIIPVEDYFSGLYIGGTGAMHHATLDGGSSVDFLGFTPIIPILPPLFAAGNVFNDDVGGGSVDGYGGIQGGFGWTFNHVWYLGIQGFGEWGSQSNSNNGQVGPTTVSILPAGGILGGLVTNTNQANTSTTVKISNDYGVAAKLGYVVAPRTMVYGKIGASWADVKVSNSTTASNSFNINLILPSLINISTNAFASSDTTQNETGLLLGIGFEQFIYQDMVSFNVEYNYVNYGTVDTGPTQLFGSSSLNILGINVLNTPVAGLPFTTQANGSATVNSLLGGINFYFGRNWF